MEPLPVIGLRAPPFRKCRRHLWESVMGFDALGRLSERFANEKRPLMSGSPFAFVREFG
jgi:hypothetical protein